jgi:hypothetical protein
MGKKKESAHGKTTLTKEKLLKELGGLIKKIDMEGLLFLIKQANILIYNKSVEELNKKMDDLEAQKTRDTREEKKPGDEVEIEEKPEGENFTVAVQGARLFFTREEMRSMVKICHASEDDFDAALRLYNWFSRERKDVLIDGRITANTHPSLKSIYRKLISTYKVKE